MVAKVLVVDDEQDLELLINQKLRKKIRADELQLTFARNGAEALQKFQADRDIDVVLTDLNMPVMDGLTLMRNLQGMDAIVGIVVISAYGDMSNIRGAMNSGAFDFLTKPIDFPDLEITLDKTIRHVKHLKENFRLRLEKEEELMQSEAYAQEQAKLAQLALQELQHTQEQLIQSEKMSSLGQLVAGIAHEITNPVNFICGNLAHVNSYAQTLVQILELFQRHYPEPIPEIKDQVEFVNLDLLKQDMPKLLSSMQLGTDRIRQVLLSLRHFSYMNEMNINLVDVHESIDNALMVLHNSLKSKPYRKEIEVVKEYGEIPQIESYGSQLNQVVMNILMNAIDAIDSSILSSQAVRQSTQALNSASSQQQEIKRIHIQTALLDSGNIEIHIADNGKGIAETEQRELFDFHFTTKSIGKVSGLGLAISHQIVTQKHRGKLTCNSTLGEGSEFIIVLPVKQKLEQE